MAGKNKRQKLSPENYIKQRSRNLALGKCWVNSNWEETGLAQILITREHTNGNKTLCVYLADLKCLGIKDTFWKFNLTDLEFQNYLAKVNSGISMKEAPYTLVHNIIFAGVEFAEESGFKPHKDFTNVSEYFLEEDTDEIELIDIECGHEGKPLYVQGPGDTPARINSIISQLERTYGPDGFHYLLAYEEEEDDFEFDEGNEVIESAKPEFVKERLEDFFRLSSVELNELSQDEVEKLMHVTDDLCAVLLSDTPHDFSELWEDEFNAEISSENFTNEMLGIDKDTIITDDDRKLLSAIDMYDERFLAPLKKLEDKWGEFAFGAFVRQQFEAKTDSAKAVRLLDEALEKYPGNAVLKMERYSQQLLDDPENCKPIAFKDFFENRTEITGYEMFKYQAMKLASYMHQKDLDAMDAMYYYADEIIGIDNEYYPIIYSTAELMRITLLRETLMSASEEEFE